VVATGRGRRKRKKDASDAIEGEPGSANLSSAEHAWWADRDELESGVPQGKKRKQEEPPKRTDGFQQYYSTESLFEPGGDVAPTPEENPYRVLGVPEAATWEEITVAHRRLAKLHHPDHLVDSTAEELGRSEARIRDLNIAYTELRRRRDK
jgi:DnaJ-domain-containing protein 1